jgi:hypothetical protein
LCILSANRAASYCTTQHHHARQTEQAKLIIELLAKANIFSLFRHAIINNETDHPKSLLPPGCPPSHQPPSEFSDSRTVRNYPWSSFITESPHLACSLIRIVELFGWGVSRIDVHRVAAVLVRPMPPISFAVSFAVAIIPLISRTTIITVPLPVSIPVITFTVAGPVPLPVEVLFTPMSSILVVSMVASRLGVSVI